MKISHKHRILLNSIFGVLFIVGGGLLIDHYKLGVGLAILALGFTMLIQYTFVLSVQRGQEDRKDGDTWSG